MREADERAALAASQARAAREGWKALMPVRGRPFLDFVLSSLADADCGEVAVVIGPEQHAPFAEFTRPGRTERTRITLIEQIEARGTADAVLAAAPWVGDDDFLVVNGDNLYPPEALRDLVALDGPGLAVFDRDALVASSNIPPERIADFAAVRLTAQGDLAGIVEKPAQSSGTSEPRLVSMNLWRYDGRIFPACREIAPSTRGEYELPAAVLRAVARGVQFRARRASGPVLDLSRQVDISEVERRLAGVEPRP
jgi:glucose-1-phosphate thymidylyltransferase